MEPIISDIPYKSGDEVLMFVNGLGGTPLIELYIVYRKAAEIAKKAGLKVTRSFVGSYITSLEMAGTSITLLKLDARSTKLWDAPVHTAALARGASENDHTMAANSLTAEAVLRWLQNCAETFRQHKDELTQLDAAIGDADHGANMARGFTAVKGKLGELKDKDIGAIFKTVAMTLISTVGGASGPLYGTFFLQAAGGANGKTELTHAELSTVFNAGLQGLMNRGKAAVGEKTMVDALVPALEALKPAGATIPSGRARRAPSPPRRKAPIRPCRSSPRRAAPVISGERSAGHLDPGRGLVGLAAGGAAKSGVARRGS